MGHFRQIFCCFFLATIYYTPESIAVDTISKKQSLSGDKQLISNGSNFALGFFRPDERIQKYYLGIWFSLNKVSILTPVWEANRESPVTDPKKSELKISDTDGNIILLDESNSIIWSSSANIPPNISTVAVLRDTGNLQLIDKFNSSFVIWQSFDHPTNTWLPGAKFGYNKLTNRTQSLMAWKSSVDPTPGIFTFEAAPFGINGYHSVWNRSRIYWQSGLWSTAEHTFSNIPEMVNAYVFIYNFNYVNTTEENYFTYSAIDSSFISRLVLDVSGQIQQLSWVASSQQWTLFWTDPKQLCQIYALCGPNGVCNENVATICSCPEGFSEKYPSEWSLRDFSGGCVREFSLQCHRNSSANRKPDAFLMMPGMRLPDNPLIVNITGTEVCETACRNDCSCTAYSQNNSGCFIWKNDLLNLQEQYDGLDAATLFLRVVLSEPVKSKKKLLIWVTANILVFLAVSLVVILILLQRLQRRAVASAENVSAGTLVRFKYSELHQATKNFSQTLGCGGFGKVFKGSLPNSSVIAVKMLQGINQGEKQFRTEVITIGTVQHVNLVRLVGFCAEEKKKILVYEYMPNGSLATQLFRNPPSLDWSTRYDIALGIARGLTYLHENCRHCIIHCDIKPENILLDASFVPKVADFGLAKIIGHEFSRVLTTVRGTRGYLAPEWIAGMPITAKADVYSYGMMLFEIISGRRNLEKTEDSEAAYFPTVAASKLVMGDVVSLLDSRLKDNADLDQLERACRIAFWCIQDSEKSRPNMCQVVQFLEGVVDVQMPPIPRRLMVFA